MMFLDAFHDPDEVFDSDELYNPNDCCDPDTVVPVNSPLQKVVDLRLDPTSELPVFLQGDQDIDDFHLDTPWAPELRVSGQSVIHTTPGSVLPSPVDAVLLNQLCNGRIPCIGWQAQHEMLPRMDFQARVKESDHTDDMNRRIISSNAPHVHPMTPLSMGSNDASKASAIDVKSQPPLREKLDPTADPAHEFVQGLLQQDVEMLENSPAIVEYQLEVSQTTHHPQVQPIQPREVTVEPGLAMPTTPCTPNGPGPDFCSPGILSSGGLRRPELMSPTSRPSDPGELASIMASPTSEINGHTSQAIPSIRSQVGDLLIDKENAWRRPSFTSQSPPGLPGMSTMSYLASPTSPRSPSSTSPLPYGSYSGNGFIPRPGLDYSGLSIGPYLKAGEMMDYDSSSSSAMARRRLGVPLSLPGRDGEMTVMSFADTGADENTMTLEAAGRLGLKVTSEAEDLKDFCLANGNVIRSLGKAISRCNFSQGYASPDALVAIFYIFQTLVEPIIMGLEFLEVTETLNKHRDRLVELDVQPSQPLRVLAMGVPRRNLVCRLAQNIVLANVDSGSDLDFVSGKYARTHNLALIPNNEDIMLADGTIVTTSGVARLPLLVGVLNTHDNSENSPGSIEITGEFHVFDDMIHDVLIGYATIEKLKVFTRHNDSLLPELARLGMSSINIIRLLKKNWSIAKFFDKVFGRQRSNYPKGTRASLQDGDEDQLVNARHSMEMTNRYDPFASPVSQNPMSVDYIINQVGSFVCTFEGCNAAPFQTQYLLNSHANIHKNVRPHFCPVKGCPRSQGGKGFKRKNEMIRHGLVHESPGYVCPFCPDREHKYPRPENLQRHVRVHHTDKDKDDPRLREVLAHRPDGPNRGHRRRGVPEEATSL